MDPVYLIWLFAVGALVGGGIIGAIAYRNLTPTIKEASSLKAELDQVRQELDGYKASVNTHFDKTSELVNELTQDYVKVYKHLAEGAQALGDAKDFTHVLEQHQGKVLIAVDAEPEAQDTVVSELPPESQESQQTPQQSSELLDETSAQEKVFDDILDVAARVEVSDSPEILNAQGENKEPVLDVEDSAPNRDDGVSAIKAEKGSGNDGIEENLVAEPGIQEEPVPPLSSETETDAAKTA